jgi:5'-3' exonuclease
MLFYDFSQIIIGNNIDFYASKKQQKPTLEQTRRVTLVSIFSLKRKLKKYVKGNEDVFLCLDTKNYWRKEVFEYYKSHRKKDREESTTDWELFFEHTNQIKDEFRAFLPFHLIEVDGAEGDDIIATLSKKFCSPDQVNVIVSSDKDFLQIKQTICSNIKQYSPWHKKFIDDNIQEYDLFTHILRGDSGDGIPNFLSDGDALFNPNKRQKKLSDSKIDQWRFLSPEEFCENIDVLNNYKRNKKLIDLREIPKEVKQKILGAIEENNPPHGRLFSYITKYKLSDLLDRDFL